MYARREPHNTLMLLASGFADATSTFAFLRNNNSQSLHNDDEAMFFRILYENIYFLRSLLITFVAGTYIIITRAANAVSIQLPCEASDFSQLKTLIC